MWKIVIYNSISKSMFLVFLVLLLFPTSATWACPGALHDFHHVTDESQLEIQQAIDELRVMMVETVTEIYQGYACPSEADWMDVSLTMHDGSPTTVRIGCNNLAKRSFVGYVPPNQYLSLDGTCMYPNETASMCKLRPISGPLDPPS